ncbi:MAG: MBL fold metallo-hydrolase [Sandaracinaceae bacterium]|nr:MBL fold metallo-hydrolase [Sandaracinaceae bacterium]
MRPAHVLGPLHRLRGMRVSNVFLLDGGPGDRFLIDTGHVLERPLLLAGLRASGLSPRELTGVLLTHCHSDHAGNAAYLRRTFGVPIIAHRRDAAILEGFEAAPSLVSRTGDPFARLFCAIENRTRTRVVVDRALEGGESIAGLEVHHVPGHTRGSILFRHVATASLLSGDALLAAVPPLTIVQRMCLPHPDYAISLDDALASLRAFLAKDLPFENLLAGHGRPILGGARARASELLCAA